MQTAIRVEPAVTEHRLLRAIRNEQPICFRYTRIGDRAWENRCVSPWRVEDTGTGKVLLTWDHERAAVRSFRLDFIEAITTCPWYEYLAPDEAP